MPTRQEQIDRHKLAEAARARLKSGTSNESTPEKGYTTRQEQIDAFRSAQTPLIKPSAPMPSTFSNIPTFKPEPIAPMVPRAQHDYTGAIENHNAPLPAFSPKPVDKALLPSNNTVRASANPKPTNPIVAGYGQLVHGMQSAIGFQQQPTSKVPTTGSKGVDDFLRGTGSFLPGLASGQTEAQIAGAGSKVVKSISDKLLPKVVDKAFKASPQAAFAIQKAAPAVTRVAGHAADAGLENARVGAGAGQTDLNQIGENLAVGAGIGAAGSAAMPLLSKTARAVIDKFKKKAPPAAPAPTLALPAGKPRGNANGVQTPDVITPDYQFKLPLGDEYGRANRAAATEDLQNINKEIAHLNGRYEAAVTAEFKRVQDAAKQRIADGKVKRTPSKHDMMTQARQSVEASWLEQNDYHNTMEALTSVRDQLTSSLNKAESGLQVTDAQIASTELGFGKRAELPKTEPLKPKQELPMKPKRPGAPMMPKQESPKAEPKAETPKKPKTGPTRANFATMADAEGISPEMKAEIAKLDDSYQPITNKESVAAADQAIAKDGVKDSALDFLSTQSTEPAHIAKGYRLMQMLDARGEWKTAAEVAAKVAADLTKGGQLSQAGYIIKRLSPEGQLLALSRKAEKSGMKVTPEDTKAFTAAAKDFAAGTSAETRSNAMQDVLDKLEAGKQPTAEDIKVLQSSIKRAKKFLPEEKPKAAKAKPEKPAAEAKPKTKRDAVLETMQAAEEEAWKRIRARRNIGFTPGKGNEVVDYAIIAANRVARGTIKASDHVAEIVKLFGEDVRPIATKIYNASLKHVARHPELKTIRKTVFTAEEVVKQWEKKTATTGKDLEKVRELAKSLGKLEGKEGKKAEVQMQQIMNKYEKSSITDRVQALRFMAMLGNTATQSLNASSNIAMATLKNITDVTGSMIDIALSKALKQPRTTTAIGRNPYSFTVEMFKNMGVGAKANWKGVNPAGLHSVSELRGLAFTHKANPLHWAEKSLRAVAGGADYGIYKTQFDNEILKQARLAAKLKPKVEREKFIRDFKANPPSEALEIADNIGKETTFQQRNSLGDVSANAVSSLGKKGGAGKLVEQGVRAVVPFIRTPLNILETGINLTPGGLLRGTVELIMAKSPAAQRKAIQQLALGVTGTGMGAAGYYLHKVGIITDANDSGNKNLDEVRAEAGKGAYRFNQSGMLRYLNAMFAGDGVKAAEDAASYQEGDRTFNYNKLQPIAFPVALGAGFEKGGLTEGLTQGVGSLLNMSSLKSIQDVVNTGYSGSAGDKQLGVVNRIAESYLKSFSPSLVAQEARREDTTQRQTPFNKGFKNDVLGYYKSRVPSLGGLVPEAFTSKSLPAKVNPLGQTKLGMKGAWSNYANPYQSDKQQYSKAAAIVADLIDRTGDDSIAPSPPSKKLKGVDIPPARYEQYQRDIGGEITQKILDLNKDIGDDEQVKRIAQIMLDTKNKYADKLKKEMGIKDKVR